MEPHEHISLERLLGLQGSVIAKSIDINGIRLSPDAAERRLAQFCKPLIVLNDDPVHVYSFRGSCTLLRFEDKLLCLATKHQVSDLNPEKIGIFIDEIERIITPSYVNFISFNSKSEFYEEDICVFLFKKGDYRTVNLNSTFFAFQIKEWHQMRVDHLIAFGFPYQFRAVDYDRPEIRERQIMMTGSYETRIGSSNLHLAHFDAGKQFDADGLSGGAVFFIGGRPGNYAMELAGMILQGGKKSSAIRFLGADFLGRVIRQL